MQRILKLFESDFPIIRLANIEMVLYPSIPFTVHWCTKKLEGKIKAS